MGITSLDIINNLSAHRAKIINRVLKVVSLLINRVFIKIYFLILSRLSILNSILIFRRTYFVNKTSYFLLKLTKNSEKLSIIKTNNNKTHVYYDHNAFFLTIDNLKGYFE